MLVYGLPCDKNARSIFGHPQDGPAGIAHRDVGYKVGQQTYFTYFSISLRRFKI